jgi:hypothetical protein
MDPLSAFHQLSSGMVLYFVRRYDEAILQFQNALRTSPELWIAHCGLMHTFNITGRSDRALASAQVCFGRYGSQVKDVLASGYAAAGYQEAMRRAGDFLATGAGGTYVAPDVVFVAYVHAGQKDLARQWLSKSADERSPNVFGAVRDPFVNDTLRDSPWFKEISRRTKLPI